jgi:hypothetical protein
VDLGAGQRRNVSGGAAYAMWTIGTQSRVTNSSVPLILLSIVIFLIGLVSQQISSFAICRTANVNLRALARIIVQPHWLL